MIDEILNLFFESKSTETISIIKKVPKLFILLVLKKNLNTFAYSISRSDYEKVVSQVKRLN